MSMGQALTRSFCLAVMACTFLGGPAMGQVRDEQKWREFFEAVEQDDVRQVREFLKSNRSAATAFSSSGDTALHLAARNDHAEIVKVLLAAGANPNARNDNAMGETALHVSSQRGDSTSRMSVLPLLIAAGGKVNLGDAREGSMPLHAALSNGNLTNASILLMSKANPNAADRSGRTPLFEAMHKDSIRRPAIQLLLSAGANPNLRGSDGQTPLHLAAFYGDEASVRMLFSVNSDVNARSKSGETPLHLAAKQNHIQVAGQLLVRMTPDAVRARDTSGQTALGNAADTGNAELVSLLMQYGLQPEIEHLVVLLDRGAHAAAKQLTHLHPQLVQRLRADMRAELAKEVPQYMRDRLSRDAFQVHANLFLGERDAAKALLRKFDQMACGNATPLMDAVSRKDVEAAQVLLELGANPNAQAPEPLRAWLYGPGPMSSSGFSFLRYEFPAPCKAFEPRAATPGAEKLVEMRPDSKAAFSSLRFEPGPVTELSLQDLKKGTAARRSTSDFFGSALLVSVGQGDLPMAKLLLQYGADPKLASRVPPNESAQSSWLAHRSGQRDAEQWRAILGIQPAKKP